MTQRTRAHASSTPVSRQPFSTTSSCPPPLYTDGWCVGENGAVATTSDGGITWTNVADDVDATEFFCNPVDPGDPDDAYIIHFFSNDPLKGILAAEYRKVYTTIDGGLTWTKLDVTTDGPDPAEPAITYIHDSPINNLEWWGLEFDDPTDSASGAYLVGGIGNQKGYMYRTEGIWTDDWLQVKNYEFLDPNGIMSQFCAPTTQYDVLIMDTSATPVQALSVGYGSQIFDYKSGVPNYDPGTCTVLLPGSTVDTWVEQPRPPLPGDREPLFRALAKLSGTEAVAAGGFGRIIHYDTATGVVTDQGSVNPNRLNDGLFFDVSGSTTGVVTGQFLDINVTTDNGLTWDEATADWAPDDNHQSRGIAFNDTGDAGIVVGDMLGEPFLAPYLGKGFIARTVNGDAENWQIVAAPAGVRDLHDVTIVASATCDGSAQLETAFAVGALGTVLKSTDSGATWTDKSPPGLDGRFFGVSFSDPCTGYAVGDLGSAFITADGGDNWSSTGIGTGETVYDIQTWGDGSQAVAVGENGGVWIRSGFRFAKVDWQVEGLSVDEDLYDVEVLNDGDEIWISGDQGVLLYRDPTLTWSKPPSGTTIILPKVSFPTTSQGFAIGGTFTILKTL